MGRGAGVGGTSGSASGGTSGAGVGGTSGSAAGGTGGSGIGGSGGSGGAPGSVEAFVAAYAKALCEDSAHCCTAQGATANVAKCNQFLSSQLSLIVAGVNKGTIVYDAGAAAQCLQALQQAVATCSDAPLTSSNCETALTGTLPPGSACDVNVECLEPPNGDTSCENGACVQEPRGVAGSPCKSTCKQDGAVTVCYGNASGSANCYTNDGLYCDETTNLCATRLPIGATGCSSNVSCVEGAYCDAGTCAATLPAGSSCTSDECDPNAAYCESGACAAKLANGASCTGAEQCAGGACRDAKCAQKLDGLLILVCE